MEWRGAAWVSPAPSHVSRRRYRLPAAHAALDTS